ncbi:MAG: HupE/UreJ family protein [Nodosilinea sp.]
MNRFKDYPPSPSRIQRQLMIGASILVLLVLASPALAHHLMGGRVPDSALTGFLSGLAHPLIGLDHAAFILAIGLLAATKPRGLIIPIVFSLMAMVGTAIHLTNLTLVGTELGITLSLVVFSLFLAIGHQLPLLPMVILAALAGVCHGYGYGESIFGAQLEPLISYLIGFTVIQLIISLGAYSLARFSLGTPELIRSRLSTPGWILCGVGLALIYGQSLEALLTSLKP